MTCRIALLSLGVLLGCDAGAPSTWGDTCPPEPPARADSLFPLHEGQQWHFRYSCTYTSFSAVEYERKVTGDLTWTFGPALCAEEGIFTIEGRFSGKVTETTDYIYLDSVHVTVDSLHHEFIRQRSFDTEEVIIPGPDMGSLDAWCLPGPDTLAYTIAWYYPITAPDTVRANALLGAGFGSSSHASVELVCNEGLVRFGQAVGRRSSGWSGAFWRVP